MIWAMLIESIYITIWFWTKVFPKLFKLVMYPIKLSVLHITTLFKGWKPVAEAMAAQELGYKIAIGKLPQNPSQRDIDGLLTKAHSTIALGAFINAVSGFWILANLIY